jgi:hypothetical protein
MAELMKQIIQSFAMMVILYIMEYAIHMWKTVLFMMKKVTIAKHVKMNNEADFCLLRRGQ